MARLEEDELQNIDSVIAEMKSLLDEEENPAKQRERTLRQKIETESNGAGSDEDYFSSIVRGASESADRAVYRNPERREELAQEVRTPVRQSSSFVAYNSDFGAESRFRDHFAPRQLPPELLSERRAVEEEQPELPSDAERETRKNRKSGRKSKHPVIRLLLMLLLVVLLCFGGLKLFAKLTGAHGKTGAETETLCVQTFHGSEQL